ncbi:dihydrofolate reductase family protein [Mucilaginibacter sp. OK098]|uniref:dihydrofolate reductase family protein n=1 Tax=Mucilaginibacter sp. OK098 TaxID=1855297 RepID=UPI000918A284|nr:dihydrofolate reductase family protein [Mucilaginibacter sp. OK098]SHM14211.1 Dihydrofolate reductase [Mucilaginibacter sp. OK098]
MRKLKLQMQISIDGFAAGPNGENDWMIIHGKQDPEVLQKIIGFGAELAAGCDTILLGRKMTPGFIGHWENVADNQQDNPWHPLAQLIADHRKIVFSHTETSIPGRNVEVENGDLATAIQALKNQPGKDLLVYGGASFVSSLVSLNLIDEYYIIVNPVAIGAGLSIFKERKILKLESSVAYKNGKVLNKYVPV